MRSTTAFLAFLPLLAPSPSGALPQGEEAPAPEAPHSPTHHVVPRTSSPVKVDGILDEEAWQTALRLTLDYETLPGENIKPPVETEFFITHDDDHLYVAFRAHDPDPSQIRAHLTDRDTAWSDDLVGIFLDPFNDERRGFGLFVNPLGVQGDLFQDDVSGREDSSWDAIWDSAGRITEEGYLVEFAIPFHQLRFPRGEGQQTWGFDALRFYPRNQRHRISVHPLDRNRNCYLCQVSKMTGFQGITPGRNMEITPTLTSQRTDQRESFPDGRLEEGKVDVDPGLTVKWGITPNLTFNAALNPDFSQVEADVAQLDINTQFALFFPERRPFFLEGADFFNTPFNVVFTRTVADPRWGLKLTGKQGKHALGVFAAEDAVTNLLFPGSQGSRGTSLGLKTTDAALRYRRDFGQSSAVGALFTSREGDGYSNRVGGIDGLYRFRDSDSLRFQFLTSQTEYPGEVVRSFNQPPGGFNDRALVLSYNHDSRNWNAYARYEDIGSDFRADLGFMPRGDFTFFLAGIERVWWGEEGDWYTRIALGGDWDLTEDQRGQLLERELEFFFNLGGPMQSFLFLGAGRRDRFFNGVLFDESFVNSFFVIQPTGDLEVSLFGRAGDQIDFANTRAGDVLRLEPSINYNFGLHLRTRLSHTFERLNVEGGRLFEANLTQLRLVYQLNLRTFVRGIFQYTHIDRDPDLFRSPVEPKTERLFTQLLFSYKVNPQTVLFLGYSDNRLGDEVVDLAQKDRTFFLKLGYAWVL